VLHGTAHLEEVAPGAPTVASFEGGALSAAGATVVQVATEVWGDAREALLPPALHPTTPPAATFSFLRAPDSPVGPFTLAQLRVVCRSGIRTRGFHVSAVVDNPAAAELLAARWGYRTRPGVVTVDRHYHGTAATVVEGGRTTLAARLLDPVALSADDLQYTTTMHPARTPTGSRLLQVELAYVFHRAERGRPVVDAFAADAWGQPRLRPSTPISASLALADVTFRPIRFVCRPDVVAFEGTERVG
jgi:hypothetical protein